MRKINIFDYPEFIFGIPFFKEKKQFRRLNDEIIDLYPHLEAADKRIVGSRLRFRTDSTKFKIEILLDRVYPDRGMSFYQANVGNVFIGDGKNSSFLGIISAPDSYDNDYISAEFSKDNEFSNVTVFLPRNPMVKDINIYIDDSARIENAAEYEVKKPVVFYGSSITENGHTSASNAYNALLSRWLDFDYYNFGFSGAARGETEIAEYISKFDMSVFVYDYDHNAPDSEHLRNTHEKFFLELRKSRPDVPVIMLTRPANDCDDYEERKQIVYQTYLNAVSSGDDNVTFIDGGSFFASSDKEICTTDRTHPNDLGHYLMASVIKPVLEKLL